MMQEAQERLPQRADYTHKYNARTGRHGWLRLTPAYSVKMVEEIVERFDASLSVLDPFCGTGTTALSAVNRGHNTTTTDINPFLIWLTRTKTARYSKLKVVEADKAGRAAFDLALREAARPVAEPPIYKIERWWPEQARRFLCYLKGAIGEVAESPGPVADLLHVAFCRTLIKLSNAAFNHQSMSFKSQPRSLFDISPESGALFLDDLEFVLRGASQNPNGKAATVLGDARQLSDCLDLRFDVVVTSPPYANRMSYIRELRPYMYWLGFLANGRDAADLDWLAIGGTWGVATSRLSDWQPSGNSWLPDQLSPILSNIANESNSNGVLLSNYVAKYCEDMSAHFDNLRYLLNPNAEIHYIVGNSKFYGVVVPTQQIYADMLVQYGFSNVKVSSIRKRNSKKELIEFDVSATWPGA